MGILPWHKCSKQNQQPSVCHERNLNAAHAHESWRDFFLIDMNKRANLGNRYHFFRLPSFFELAHMCNGGVKMSSIGKPRNCHA